MSSFSLSASSRARPGYRLHPAAFCLLCFAILIAGDRALTAGMSWMVKASDHRISRIYAGSAGADVLVTGNSVGNAMLIPTTLEKQLGRPTFSIAIHGLDAVTQDAFIADLLGHNRPPKLALMEVRPVFSVQLDAPAFSSFQGLSPRLAALNIEAEGPGIHWGQIFSTYRFNSPQLPTILQKIVDRDDQATGPSNGLINEALKKRWASRTEQPAVQKRQLEAFIRSVERLRGAGCKVILVMAPLHPSARANGRWIADALAQLRATVPRNVAVVDYSHLLSSDPYFEDPIHLNSAGRAALQPALLKLIIAAKLGEGDRRTH